MTSKELIERFLEYKLRNQGASERTANQYRGSLHRLVDYCVSVGADLEHPDQNTLTAFLGPYLHKQGLGPSGRRPTVAAVRGFYRWLHRVGLAAEDYARHQEYPRAGRRLPRRISLDAAEKIMWSPDLSTFSGIRDAAVLSVLIGGGLRISGVVALNESNLQFTQDGGREQLSILTREKGSKERLVPMPNEVRLILHAYLGHPDLAAIDRLLPDGDKVLFVSLQNRTIPEHEYHGEARRIAAGGIRNIIRKHGEAAGIDPSMLHPHAFRHLYGTELAEGDVHQLVLQELMGHANAQSTAVYTALAQRKLRRAIEHANPMAKMRTPVSDLVARLK